VQSIDANINEDNSSVRYYAEFPRKAATTEEWLAGNPPLKTSEASDQKPTH
jgi:hypothetical protein